MRELFFSRNSVLIVFILILAVHVMTIFKGHGWGDDFAQYLQHAQNILNGIDYSYSKHIQNPSAPLGPQAYPPMYPVMLSLLIKMAGINFSAIKLLNVFIFLFTLFLFYLAIKGSDRFTIILSLLLIGLNPYFLYFKNEIMADLLFLFFVMLSVVHVQKTKNKERKLLSGLVAGMLFFLAYSTRSAGLSLVVAFILYEIICYRRFSIYAAAALTSFIILAGLQRFFIGDQSSYAEYFQVSIFASALEFIKYLSNLFYVRLKFIKLLFFIIITLFAVWSFIKDLKNSKFSHFFIFVYSGIIVVYGYHQSGLRFLIPLIPFYFYYAAEGINFIKFLLVKKFIIPGLFIGLYLFSYYSYNNIYNYKNIFTNQTEDIINYIKRNTNENDVVVFKKARFLSYYTGRTSTSYSDTISFERNIDHFNKNNARYLLTGPPDGEYLQEFLSIKKPEPAYSNEGYVLYKLKQTD